MATPSTESLAVSCPGCGAHFEVATEMAGRKGRCAKCGDVFRVPLGQPARTVGGLSEADSASGPSTKSASETPPTSTRHIAVVCRVCQTLMYGRPDQVGKPIKCPDCYAESIVPPPEKVKPKKAPAAMEGEQYELWGVDESPTVAELLAAQPKYIAVVCRMCQTRMQATEDQVGKKLKCPDCGTLSLVPPAEAPAKIVSVLTSDGDDLQIDAALDPGERLPVPIPVRRPLLYEEERDAERVRQGELAARGVTSGPQRDFRGRPIMPRLPLVTGVWRMLVTQEVIARWVLLSMVLGFVGQFLVESLLTPIQGHAEAIKLIFTVFGVILAAAWLAIAGPFFVAIIGDSSDGEDKILQPPQLTAFDWFPELFSFVMASSVAGLCGRGTWYLVQLVPIGPVAAVAIVGAVVVIILPMALLSTLLEASPLGVVSPRLLSSLGRCAGPWLLFYSQAMALAAVVGGAAWALAIAMRPGVKDVPTLLWILAPLVVAALIVEMRLLGRLAWWISERTPAQDEPTST